MCINCSSIWKQVVEIYRQSRSLLYWRDTPHMGGLFEWSHNLPASPDPPPGPAPHSSPYRPAEKCSLLFFLNQGLIHTFLGSSWLVVTHPLLKDRQQQHRVDLCHDQPPSQRIFRQRLCQLEACKQLSILSILGTTRNASQHKACHQLQVNLDVEPEK